MLTLVRIAFCLPILCLALPVGFAAGVLRALVALLAAAVGAGLLAVQCARGELPLALDPPA